jgi:single-strand DNA-binding protein
MYQKTVVVGHLGRDPEMKYTPQGVPVTDFSVATSFKWTNAAGQVQERTTWFRVTCWRKLAELTAQYLKKGRLVLVEGDIAASAFTDKKTGEARASLELTATNIKFLGPKSESEGEEYHDDGPKNHGSQPPGGSPDEIPSEWQG